MDPDLKPAVLSGALAALVVLLGFVAVHSVTIGFFPGFFVEGPLPVMLAGALAGRAWHRLRPHLPPGSAGGAVLALALWVPAGALTLAGRWLRLGLDASGAAAALAFVAGSLALAWLLVRRRVGPRAASAFVAAALIPTLLFGGSGLIATSGPRTLPLAGGSFVASLLAGALMVALHARLRARPQR